MLRVSWHEVNQDTRNFVQKSVRLYDFFFIRLGKVQRLFLQEIKIVINELNNMHGLNIKDCRYV